MLDRTLSLRLFTNTFRDKYAPLEFAEKPEECDEAEWEAFTNALTTNLTSFFREAHHFPILAEHALKRAGRRYDVWCCAASTGEEPYSIAITLTEALGGVNPPISRQSVDAWPAYAY